MDALISAIAGDLVSRLISFLGQKYLQQQQSTTEEEELDRLRRVLRRIRVVVEEAEARQVTNRAIILQLRDLMEGMYLGYHVLDAFKLQSIGGEYQGSVLEAEDHEAIPYRKRLRFSTSRSLLASGSDSEGSTAMIKNVVASLEVKISDVREFVTLLASCPRLPQEPYSTYLFMDKCMFGRQAEKERVISFLLHEDPNLSVLPVIGPHRIGKKTLVHHACQDERVRGRFPHIVFLHEDDLMTRSRSLEPLRKYLCVIELSNQGVDEESWEAFRSFLRKAAGHGSKVIIIARTENEIARWGGRGTVPPVRLRSLSREEYWYYFKALAFGSMNPDEHPTLASLGMQLATELKGSFLGANIIGYMLRSNPDVEIWRGVLMGLREMMQKRFSIFGDGVAAHHRPREHLGRNNASVDHMDDQVLSSSSSFMCYRGCIVYALREAAASHARSELPRLTLEGPWMGGKVLPCDERLDKLVWISRIPPFCNYVATFVMQRPRRTVRRKNHPTLDNY